MSNATALRRAYELGQDDAASGHPPRTASEIHEATGTPEGWVADQALVDFYNHGRAGTLPAAVMGGP